MSASSRQQKTPRLVGRGSGLSGGNRQRPLLEGGTGEAGLSALLFALAVLSGRKEAVEWVADFVSQHLRGQEVGG